VFRCVALVQIAPVLSAIFTNVVRLFSLGKFNLFKVISLPFLSIETEPSEKNNSKSSVVLYRTTLFLYTLVQSVLISSHSLKTFPIESVTIKTNSSGLYGCVFHILVQCRGWWWGLDG